MKKLLITGLLIGTALLAGAKGNEKKVQMVSDIEAGSIGILFTNKNPSSVIIKLTDNDGRVLQSNRIKNKDGFFQPYNVKHLDKGIYNVQITENGQLIYESSVLIDNNKSAVRKTADDKYQVTFADEQVQSVVLGIMNSEGSIVHKETLVGTDGFSRVYDLSKIDGQHFTFEISSNEKIETHRL